jgi:hypothetical protein
MSTLYVAEHLFFLKPENMFHYQYCMKIQLFSNNRESIVDIAMVFCVNLILIAELIAYIIIFKARKDKTGSFLKMSPFVAISHPPTLLHVTIHLPIKCLWKVKFI